MHRCYISPTIHLPSEQITMCLTPVTKGQISWHRVTFSTKMVIYCGRAGRMLQSPSYSDNWWRRRTTRSPCRNTNSTKMFICKTLKTKVDPVHLQYSDNRSAAMTSCLSSLTASGEQSAQVTTVTALLVTISGIFAGGT